ncbi:phasin family protein [Noviherbaspirillum aridicola]|uniref:Phasin domain-containing protein n=1 Tax=Noviherbaspirillum aridicola TaxID=2849687 RepID=A0ABQ4Q2I6_9BURK|nr:phasin family protein [Noviherbaspirillum aridicola]GIZ51251.1 hypothetical protein NCCP691_12650 [Noviherbaspirillum aridicola]
MPAFPEQFSEVARANLQAQTNMLTAFFSQVLENAEQVAELNLNAAKTSLEDTTITLKQLLSARDPQEFFSLTAAQAQPAAAKAIAYGRGLAGIASNAQAEMTRTAEEQFAQAGRLVSELVDDVSRNAPAGTENVVALFKTAIGNASAGYEQFNKNSRQAAEVVEANINSAVGQFAQAAEKTVKTARK